MSVEETAVETNPMMAYMAFCGRWAPKTVRGVEEFTADLIRVLDLHVREERDRLQADNDRLRTALKHLASQHVHTISCYGAHNAPTTPTCGRPQKSAEHFVRHAKTVLAESRIPDDAEGVEAAVMDVAREFAEAGATVHFIEGDGTVTDYEAEEVNRGD